ncbi:hypothetical protein BS47DRAFT_1323917 [Hydnum rufescens UP504]|uniref:Cystinosin n=1 Tax=Hydnum rufescens UP504 TaxID=1448309 RepID=A0A9P6BAQ4_9AGAM|nr:hypothetical protein BS47DRAFT_1323917 [Hydnum rufescens UP504]
MASPVLGVDGDVGLRILSAILGWTYFFAWSTSFYFKCVLLNYQRKFVGGLSIDYVNLNFLGHTSYAVYALFFFYNPAIQDEYRRRHGGHNNSVQLNDVAFSCHAATLALFTLLQTYWYPRAPGQRLSLFNSLLISLVFLIAASNLFAVAMGAEQGIDFLYLISYFKLYVTIAKFIPQVWNNFRRKSTVGWSIGNIVLDLTGGILSFVQLMIDAYRSDDWTAVTGNPVKFALSWLSILFDIVFMVQHFILYPDRTDNSLLHKETVPVQQEHPDERTPLL